MVTDFFVLAAELQEEGAFLQGNPNALKVQILTRIYTLNV
jgi:hypothetical protein